MPPSSAAQRIEQIEHLIRTGSGADARTQLQKLATLNLPREVAVDAARLAWRANLPLLGIRWLGPYVRSTRRVPGQATALEKAEYASCLVKLGAEEEALELLRKLDSEKTPVALLYEASALMSRWDYAGAIPLLRRFVRAKEVGNYQRLVGRVNLAACLVYERHHLNATMLLRDLVYETSVRRLSLLHGNALELSAQNCILQRKLSMAEKFLSRASEMLRASASRDEFYVRKWKAMVELSRQAPMPKSLSALEKIREEGAERGHWETLRDCDRVLALSTGDGELIWKLYFGTPYESFRKRLLADFKRKISPPPYFEWMPPGSSGAEISLDVFSGSSGKGIKLRAGSSLHRLLGALASDFYRPFRIASLHARLFPGEFFNPDTSPLKVHQAIKLLKKWFRTNGLPLDIEEKDRFYRIRATGNCALRVPGETKTGDKQSVTLAKLRAAWPEEPFSIREVASLLDVSARTALRIVDEARKAGWLVRVGIRAGTRYQFVDARRKVA